MLILDVDGTLSDGMYLVSSNKVVTKNFYTRDFCAIEKLLKRGIKVLILTSSDDDCIKNKMEINGFLDKYSDKLFVHQRINNKKKHIEYVWGKCWNVIAYMGDAENDLKSMKLSSISACPCDAEKPILKIAKYISPYKGGHGAVADFVEFLLENEK